MFVFEKSKKNNTPFQSQTGVCELHPGLVFGHFAVKGQLCFKWPNKIKSITS